MYIAGSFPFVLKPPIDPVRATVLFAFDRRVLEETKECSWSNVLVDSCSTALFVAFGLGIHPRLFSSGAGRLYRGYCDQCHVDLYSIRFQRV